MNRGTGIDRPIDAALEVREDQVRTSRDRATHDDGRVLEGPDVESHRTGLLLFVPLDGDRSKGAQQVALPARIPIDAGFHDLDLEVRRGLGVHEQFGQGRHHDVHPGDLATFRITQEDTLSALAAGDRRRQRSDLDRASDAVRELILDPHLHGAPHQGRAEEGDRQACTDKERQAAETRGRQATQAAALGSAVGSGGLSHEVCGGYGEGVRDTSPHCS